MIRGRALRDLPRSVWTLGWGSFFTDTASEAIYPILPYFVIHALGGNPISLGVIEGAADATNSLVKLWSGRWSDRTRARKPLVVAGYGIATVVRPLTALATTWWHVFAVRCADRFGKGIRGAPRDALLADLAPIQSRGLAFGFHRAMDNAGAVVGPLLASAYLFCLPGHYRSLFALTIVPGSLAVLLLMRLPEPGTRARSSTPTAAATHSWRELPPTLWRVLVAILVFTLGNSTDAFLLWRLTDVTGGITTIPLLWAGLNLIKSVTAVVGGGLSDRFDRRLVIASGWGVYAAVYAGFAVAQSAAILIVLFFIYGLYFGLTEGVERALIADFAPASLRGTAFGIYNAALGVGAMIASLVFGVLWETAGAAVAFGTGAGLAVGAAVLMLTMVPRSSVAS